jgi:diguanylate cyclase (GGDEF)-like protein/PAS domain S-box-containing protein
MPGSTHESTSTDTQYRGLFSSNPQPMWVFDAETLAFLDVNDAALALYGYTREEFLGMTVLDVRPPADIPAVRAKLASAGDGAISGYWRHVTKDGASLLCHVIANVIEFEGRPARLSLVTDVTDRLRAEEALRDSEQRLAEAQQLARVGSWHWDVADNRVTWSAELFRIHGLTPQEFRPTYEGFLSRVHADDRGRVAAEVSKALDQPGPFGYDYRILGAADEVRHIHTVGRVEVDDDGRPVRLVGTCQDVTDTRHAEDELRASEERYRSLVELSPDAIGVASPDGRILYLNPAAGQLLGTDHPERMVGRYISELIHPDSVEVNRERMARLNRGDAPQLTEERLIRADGSSVTVEVTSCKITWHGEPAYQTVARDVSVRKEADVFVNGYTRVLELVTQGAVLTETLSVITRLVEELSDGTRCSIVLIEDGYLRHGAAPSLPDEYNAAVDGLPVGEGVGSCGTAAARGEPVIVSDIATDDLWRDHRDIALPFGLRSCWSMPITDSTSGDVLASFAVYSDRPRSPTTDELRLLEQVTHLAEIAIARKRVEEALAHQALHDDLTGLPNRALLLDRLGQALARARRQQSTVAVLFLDLDHFKVLNDSRGHAAGDELLQAVAGRLRDVIRPSDTVSRFGGDEFVIITEGVSGGDDATLMGERITKAVEAPFLLSAGEVFVSVSVGIALAGDDATPETLLRDADVAMYRAKERGRARTEVFDEMLRVRSRARFETETDLRRAIERGELTVEYQPVVAVQDGTVVGAEALVRWQHPERGLVLPGEFIPLAEEVGLVMPIGAWVLEESCRQARAWVDSVPPGTPFTVAVNLSARQLLLPELVDLVVNALDRAELHPLYLRLEITETVLMEDVDFAIERLLGLRDLGVRLAVDDFGTGYSSLSYLRQLPVDLLKIDRSFVEGLGVDPHNSSIVAAVVALAEALGLFALAEGVETRLQVAELKSLGCQFAQGYHYAPPLPAAEFGALVGRKLP